MYFDELQYFYTTNMVFTYYPRNKSRYNCNPKIRGCQKPKMCSFPKISNHNTFKEIKDMGHTVHVKCLQYTSFRLFRSKRLLHVHRGENHAIVWSQKATCLMVSNCRSRITSTVTKCILNLSWNKRPTMYEQQIGWIFEIVKSLTFWQFAGRTKFEISNTL